MKKTLLSAVMAGLAIGAQARQGQVILENANNSFASVTINSANGPLAQVGTYEVALLWYNGSTFQQIGAVYQPSTANNDGPGYFFGEAVTVPTYSATGTFEVEGWTGNFANYAAAYAAVSPSQLLGQTAPFTAAEANLGTTPAGIPTSITRPGQWDGNLILVTPDPEPSTIALGGLGAAALLFFRRRRRGES